MAKRPIDHTRFGPNGDPTTADGAISTAWWTKTGDDLAKSVSHVVESIAKSQELTRQAQAVISARLYGNVSLSGMYGLDLQRVQAGANQLRDRISYNLVQSVIDTLVSKITKNRPRPLFLTSGGNWKQIRRAKKLNKFVDGIFYENRFYELATHVFRDACVIDGAIHVYADRENKKVRYERVIATELLVDEQEAFSGTPRQMHRVKNVDRRVLQAAFKDKAKELDEVAHIKQTAGGATQISDLVTVRESWHLRSGKKATDGKHAITVDGLTLLEEEWTRDRFPFALMPFSKRLVGFWGQSLAEQLQPIQLEINKLLWTIQRSMHLAGSFKIFMEKGSKIVKEHFNNEIGTIIAYAGTKPEYGVPPIISPEIYQHLVTLKQSGYEQAGISMLSATGVKPAGLNAGKALREYNDIESERFNTIGKSYEQLALDAASLSLEVIEDDLGGRYEARALDGKKVEVLSYADVKLDRDAYVMQCFPVSSLPNDPEGRLQTIQEYIQAGMLTQRQGRRLLDFPDLEANEGLANAAEEYLTKILDGIVDNGEYEPPEPRDDLQLAAELSAEFYALAKAQGVEEPRLEMLRKFQDQVRDLTAMAMPPAVASAPPSPVPGSVPQGAPQPPPASELLPFH